MGPHPKSKLTAPKVQPISGDDWPSAVASVYAARRSSHCFSLLASRRVLVGAREQPWPERHVGALVVPDPGGVGTPGFSWLDRSSPALASCLRDALTAAARCRSGSVQTLAGLPHEPAHGPCPPRREEHLCDPVPRLDLIGEPTAKAAAVLGP